ncbi:hypothetical protein [Actinoplanes sp. DH11]|uniref:hypothetical protein n=1 Tax=Actinoplanes sp. DH11 TaxID=2857011 RepID=UPI001E418735|nr:hypothetical protein [Actinoplanes sp. DH11]
MFRNGPARHTRAEKRKERLDPVRWGRARRGTLVRLGLAAALLITAAATLWYEPADNLSLRADPPAQSSAPDRRQAPGQVQDAGQRPVEGQGESPAQHRAGIPEGKVGVPIRLADPTALTLVRPGQLVDLLDPGDQSTPVASSALVLDVTGASDPTIGGLLLALSPDEAERAVATTDRGFAILIRPD